MITQLPTNIIYKTITALFTPLVKYCIRQNIKYWDIQVILKSIFIAVAKKELEATGQVVNNSKLSLVTGIHRNEIIGIINNTNSDFDRHSLLFRIIGHWQESKKFTDKFKNPKKLTFEGADSMFSNLVHSVSKEINSYTVLFELERIGAIEYQGNEVVLKVANYTPPGDFEYGFKIVGDDINDLITIAEKNLRGEDGGIHLRTTYDNINLNSLAKLEEWLKKESAKSHERAREIIAKEDQDVNKIKKGAGGGIVTYTTIATCHFPTVQKTITPKKRGRKKNEN